MRNKMLLPLIATAALLPLTGAAYTSPKASENALETCSSAIQNEMPHARITDTFHSDREGGKDVIYANVQQWAGDRTEQNRVTCETRASGRRVVTVRTESGTWVEPQG